MLLQLSSLAHESFVCQLFVLFLSYSACSALQFGIYLRTDTRANRSFCQCWQAKLDETIGVAAQIVAAAYRDACRVFFKEMGAV